MTERELRLAAIRAKATMTPMEYRKYMSQRRHQPSKPDWKAERARAANERFISCLPLSDSRRRQ